MDNDKISHLVEQVDAWFLINRRTLPWRSPDPHAKRDPYATWISETMLQQTRVEAVVSHYRYWISRFPDVSTLANATEQEVLQYWQGLGYYSRARNLHKSAQIISCRPQFPSSFDEILALPGVGKYTAGAILSLALHQDVPILDGNVVRIFSRYLGLHFRADQDSQSQKVYWDLAQQVANMGSAYLHNEALMEFGALFCTPKKPSCKTCPLADECIAYSTDQVQNLPPSKEKTMTVVLEGTLHIITCDNQILLVRSKTGILSNQWRLPWKWSGLFSKPQIRHQITHHKIRCNVVKTQQDSKNSPDFINDLDETLWCPIEQIQSYVHNSLSWKAINLLF